MSKTYSQLLKDISNPNRDDDVPDTNLTETNVGTFTEEVDTHCRFGFS